MPELLFLGPDVEYFKVTRSVKTKIKHLIKYLLDYELSVSKSNIFVSIKPSAGFTTTVAEAILDYQNKNPNAKLHITLRTEIDTDFKELPEETQKLFRRFTAPEKTFVPVLYSVRKTDKQKKGMYNYLVAGRTVIYYYDGGKVDKIFKKELEAIDYPISTKHINLYDNLAKEYVSRGVRKRKGNPAYYYRINMLLPAGDRFKEEKGSFTTVNHALAARKKRIIEVQWQEIPENALSISDVFKEYTRTKCDTPALYRKYVQYFTSYIEKSELDSISICDFASYRILGTGEIVYSGNLYRLTHPNLDDGRRSATNIYDEETGGYLDFSVSKAYQQGYHAMIDNLFNFAYQKQYVNFNPMFLIED